MEITLSVSYPAIITSVERKTNYVGGKREGDENAFDRIVTVDEDNTELESLFGECRTDLVHRLQARVVSESLDEEEPRYYRLNLDVADEFNSALVPTLTLALFNYFINGMLSRWFIYTNQDEAALYAGRAEENLDNIYKDTMTRVLTRKSRPF